MAHDQASPRALPEDECIRPCGRGKGAPGIRAPGAPPRYQPLNENRTVNESIEAKGPSAASIPLSYSNFA